MATRVPLSAVIADESPYDVVFDANVLISAYKGHEKLTRDHTRRREDQRVLKIHGLMQQISASRRFTTALVVWQFLHPKEGRLKEPGGIKDRWAWLKEEGRVSIRDVDRTKEFQTMMATVRNENAQGDPVDFSLAACAIASAGTVAIATSDLSDFCWHDNIVVIEDFFDNIDRICVAKAARDA